MNTLAAISVGGLIPLLVELVLVGLIFWLILWFVGYVGVPEPFAKVIKVIVGLCILIYLLNLVMGLGGHPFLTL